MGQLGVLGSRHLGRIAAFAALASVGTLMVGVAQFRQPGMAAGIWYMIHSTLAAGALFLTVDLIGARRQGGSLWLRPLPPIAQGGIVAALFFAAAIGVAGLPPLSGFLGKIAILQATRQADGEVLIWTVILVTSLFAIVGLGRAGSVIFWKSAAVEDAAPPLATSAHPRRQLVEPDEEIQNLADAPSPALALTATAALVAGMAALTVFAGPVMDYATATARQLADPAPYVESVLVRQEGSR